MPSSDPLRLLHVTAPARVGGLESVVLALTTGLAARGHRVALVCVVDPGVSGHPLAQAASEAGIETELLALPSRAYLSEYRAHRALIRRLGVQVVHTHGYRPDVVAGQAARAAGVPHVTTAHGFVGGSRRGHLYEWLQLRATRLADAAVAVSRPIAARFRAVGVPEDRIVTLPNAWRGAESFPAAEARARLGVELGMPLVGWVGRLTAEKGADLFLAALARLPDGPWRAVLVGDGRERRALEAQAAVLGLGDRVRFAGVVPEAGRLMSAFDAWVLSSRTEGTPVALLEAMAAARPIVATAVGGVPDMLAPSEAWLVPPGDPAALAGALGRLLDDPVEAARRGQAARDRLRREFTAPPWIERHEALYRTLLQAPPSPEDRSP